MNLSIPTQTWPPRLPERRIHPPEVAVRGQELREAVEACCLRRWRELKRAILARRDPLLAEALDAFESAWDDREELRAGRDPYA